MASTKKHNLSSQKGGHKVQKLQIHSPPVQYAEELVHKQGQLLWATFLHMPDKKTHFCEVLRNVFTQIISYSSAFLSLCMKKSVLVPFQMLKHYLEPVSCLSRLPAGIASIAPAAVFTWNGRLHFVRGCLNFRVYGEQHFEYKRWWHWCEAVIFGTIIAKCMKYFSSVDVGRGEYVLVTNSLHFHILQSKTGESFACLMMGAYVWPLRWIDIFC